MECTVKILGNRESLPQGILWKQLQNSCLFYKIPPSWCGRTFSLPFNKKNHHPQISQSAVFQLL